MPRADIQQRYGTAEELSQELQAFLAHRPSKPDHILFTSDLQVGSAAACHRCFEPPKHGISFLLRCSGLEGMGQSESVSEAIAEEESRVSR